VNIDIDEKLSILVYSCQKCFFAKNSHCSIAVYSGKTPFDIAKNIAEDTRHKNCIFLKEDFVIFSMHTGG
jgi:hypothetical protein